MQATELLVPVLQSTAFLVALGLLFAVLLVIAEKKILNYGDAAIDINSGEKTFTVKGGNSLLYSLAQNNVFIPSACGGRGSCAYCKLTVVSGGGVVSPVEEPFLDAKERAGGIRLSCQVKVRNDIAVLVPRELFSARRYKGVLVSKKPLTGEILELRIQLLDPAVMEFTAGQYLQVHTEAYRGCEAVMRAYSISSRPSDAGFIELIIKRVPDGICTTWIFDMLKEGRPITLSGPYGTFGLSGTDSPVICIAGGSGMAPIWSMLQDMREKGNTRKVVYIFSAQVQSHLFYLDRLRAFEKEVDWFTFIPSLSREPDGSDWKGERGRLVAVLKRNLPDASRHEAYMCGAPGMIDACAKVLVENGMRPENIFYDKFA